MSLTLLVLICAGLGGLVLLIAGIIAIVWVVLYERAPWPH